MSSATSTDSVRLKPDTTSDTRSVRLQADGPGPRSVRLQADAQGLQPWQFFVLAALGCATAITFLARGQGLVPVVILGILMLSTALVGVAALRTFRPLVTAEDDRTVMIGHRTRAALEREKHLVLRAIKELEFDRAMGKLSESDFHEMSTRLRARAAGLIHQLDAGSGYREQIERDLEKRLGERAPKAPPEGAAERVCACGTRNDSDAKFCKNCGAKL